VMDEIYIDAMGFVWLGNFRLPLRLVGDEIEFVDKDRRRCHERGGRFVRLESDAFIETLRDRKGEDIR